MFCERVEKEDWSKISEDAHLTCFSEIRNKQMDTFDYALVVTNDKTICGYATIIEMDKETAYMQHGGAFPDVEKSIRVVATYKLILNYLKENYKRASTRVKNKNIPMLKLAMSQGFLITGADYWPEDNEIFLTLRVNWQ